MHLRGLVFPANERERGGGGGTFSNTTFQKEFQPSGTHARAFLKMVWFLDTKEASLTCILVPGWARMVGRQLCALHAFVGVRVTQVAYL